MKVIIRANFGKTQLQRRVADMIADQALWVEDADATIRALPSADALFCADRFYSATIAEAVRNAAPKLRWIQLRTAGYDRAKQHGVPAHITVCNAGPAYAPAVAMPAVALLLALQRRLPTILTNQQRHAWDQSCTAELTTPASSTIAVIGFGPIGREIGRLLRALDARVVAVTRRGLPDPNADEIVSGDHLHDVRKRADAIVVAASYDESTRGLIGERELRACKQTAVLVNIARGALVDARALGAALRNGTIAGAGIDVTDPEPLPADDPLWDAPNLIVTPHCAGACGAIAGERIAELACANLRRFIDGASLMHVVQLQEVAMRMACFEHLHADAGWRIFSFLKIATALLRKFADIGPTAKNFSVSPAKPTVIKAETSPGAIAIVSHGGVGTLLLCHLADYSIAWSHDQPGSRGGNYYAFQAESGALLHGQKAIEAIEQAT